MSFCLPLFSVYVSLYLFYNKWMCLTRRFLVIIVEKHCQLILLVVAGTCWSENAEKELKCTWSLLVFPFSCLIVSHKSWFHWHNVISMRSNDGRTWLWKRWKLEMARENQAVILWVKSPRVHHYWVNQTQLSCFVFFSTPVKFYLDLKMLSQNLWTY